MNAFQQFSAGRKLRRIPQLLLGLAGYGASVMLLVQSGLGAASWNVLAEGVANTFSISFGWATNIIAVLVLLAWIPIKELPGLGTFLNVFIVGFAADAMGLVLPVPDNLTMQIVYFATGIILYSFFDALYLGAQFGSGPRDGLMTGLMRISGQPVWKVRTAIEITVAVAGWFMGGMVGVGTVVIALCVGPLIGFFLPRVTVRIRPDLSQAVWFKGLAPYLSENARKTFQQTSNINITATKVAKVQEPVQGSSPAIATVSVQTNADSLKFLLSRADGQWIVEKITSDPS